MATHNIGKLLAKRARLQAPIHSNSDLPSEGPQPKKQNTLNHVSSADDCVELCSLLLEKVGADPSRTEPSEMDHLLTTEYPPRVVELLAKIASTLGHNGIIDAASDIVESSDEEPDAVVPSIDHPYKPLPSRTTDAVVPTAPVLPSSPRKTHSAVRLPDVPVPLPVQSLPVNEPVYKKETEIAISRIFDLGKVAGVQHPSIPADAPYDGPPVVTMTGFGELGRYGNQVLQYVFLKCYAHAHNISEIQVPAWVGSTLFGMQDRQVQRALPSVVEFRGTLANSTFTTDFIDYVKNSNRDTVVPELSSSALLPGASDPHVNVDVWGWFQWHTSNYAPFKDLIQDTFSPVPALKTHFEDVFNRNVRYRDGKKRTVVGLHLRLGDYQNISASSFGYCAPTSWYLDWLAEVWPTLENPVLFVASDDLDAVLRDFAAYSPITADSIGLKMPSEMKAARAGFFPDWFSLTQCDMLAISNSTFSFSACMMNQRPGARFFRAHYRGMMQEIDPWNADPIVHRDMNKAGLSAAIETLQVVYNTQGSRGLAKNLLYELPYYGIRSAIMKAVLWRQAHQNAATAI